jgi:hypothetical protein
MIAAHRGELPALELLVEHGASVAAADKLGQTLLMLAAMNWHCHVVSLLLRAGVNVDAADSSKVFRYAASVAVDLVRSHLSLHSLGRHHGLCVLCVRSPSDLHLRQNTAMHPPIPRGVMLLRVSLSAEAQR